MFCRFRVEEYAKQETIVKADAKQSHLLSHWFLARLIFDPEDGGNMFLRNVG
jgi:hypothetical protein